jgi:hypothetical protein
MLQCALLPEDRLCARLPEDEILKAERLRMTCVLDRLPACLLAMHECGLQLLGAAPDANAASAARAAALRAPF